MAQRLSAQNKKDFRATTNKLEATTDLTVNLKGIGEYELTRNAHTQIAQRLQIPQKYYDRMTQDSPELWATNVNHWFNESPENRLIRTIANGEGDSQRIRAFLSDRYRVLDNEELLENILPVLSERNDISIESCHVDDNKLFLKAFFTDLETEVKGDAKVGDLIRAGVSISNSEVGTGSLTVAPMTYRLWCTNGAYSNTSMRKYHVEGRKNAIADNIEQMLTDETKKAKDNAFWLQTRDLVKSCMTMDFLNAEVEKYSEATTKKIEGEIVEVVKATTKHFGLNEDQNSSILDQIIRSGDLTQYGLFNAVTRTAEDQTDYYDSDNLERVGGQIISLSNTEWRKLSTAVA